MSNECPDRAVLEALLASSLTDADQAATESHVESCPRCQERLEALAGVAAVLPTTQVPLELRDADDSHRLSEVIQAMRRASPPRTAIGKPETDVVPLGDSSTARKRSSRQPQQIAEYDVQAVLGRGGIGVVYRATDRTLARDVAIKVLRADLADNDSLRERFLREARAAAALRHDNVVAIYGVGQHAEQPYLVMEYVPGGSLADRLLRKGKLSWPEVVRLGIEVASSLAAAHARGIVHRDVKPGNVLWDAESARYKLTDFGLAKAIDDVSLTRSGTLVGTPEYLSPEQATGENVDARSDLFSLGALLYAAGTGESPFHADSTIGVLHRVRTFTPPNLRQVQLDCPTQLAKVVDRLLTKEPNQRYPSAGAVVEELRRIEGVFGGMTAPGAGRETRARRGRAWPARLAATVVLLVASMAVIAGWLATRDPETRSTPVSDVDASPRAFALLGSADGFDSLSDAVAAAPPEGVIEVRGRKRLPIEPVRIEGKALVIRAASGSRPVIVPASAAAAKEAAFTTDSDLTLEGLEVRWAVGATPESSEAAEGGSALKATGGTLRLDHCELTAGRRDTCIVVVEASCSLNNSRLSAIDGLCVAWRPRAGDRLGVQNCVLAGQCCLSLNPNDESGDLPASLELSHSTWQGRKGLQLNALNASRLSLAIRTDHNLFAVDHLLVLYFPFRGPRAATSPSLDFFRTRLRPMLTWQEQENHYGATTRFLSRQSPRQPLTPVDDSPKDIAAWEKFWNRPGTGSRQGEAAAELRGKVGADEKRVGTVEIKNGKVADGV
ncbi:MAG: serine/threonine-protein kinase [Pirellulales bacterium]